MCRRAELNAQVRDFLHPSRGRKAPQHWWCKPPASAHTQQALAQAASPAPAPGSKRKAADNKGAQSTKKQATTAAKRVSRPGTTAAVVPVDSAAAAAATAEQVPAAVEGAKPSQNRSAGKAKSAKKTAAQIGSESNPEQVPTLVSSTDAARDATALPVADPAAASPEQMVERAIQPAKAQPTLPGRQTKVAVPRQVAGQGLGGVSAFSARALSELMEDGPLLEALQHLLTALQAQDVVAPLVGSNTRLAAVPVAVPSMTTPSLAGSAGVPADSQSNVGTSQDLAGPDLAVPSSSSAPAAAAANDDVGAQQSSQAGPAAVPEDLPCALPVKAEGGNQAETAAGRVDAQAGGLGRQEGKRLRGNAAVLAKALGLGTAGDTKHRPTASKAEVQAGQSAGAGYATLDCMSRMCHCAGYIVSCVAVHVVLKPTLPASHSCE